MKITVQEQQKRSERARIKEHIIRGGAAKKRPKQNQDDFKNIQLIDKSSTSM
jgi:isopentenyl diphosphate isomerase/L-lactate dehydrogenase-like FMN-dependent dehydrogenase